MKKLIQVIQDLIEKRFYGQLIIKFEAGKIIHCQKTESIKLEN
jgi:hypothetical protein